jgi:hypothetical protein
MDLDNVLIDLIAAEIEVFCKSNIFFRVSKYSCYLHKIIKEFLHAALPTIIQLINFLKNVLFLDLIFSENHSLSNFI